jgi:translocator protein
MLNRASLPSLAVCLLATFAAGGIGAIASADAAQFYGSLAKPGWAPPAWLFGPVWSLLYLLMGVAVWLVWQRAALSRGHGAYILFGAQLTLNALWTWLFFAWKQGQLASLEILLLLVLIVATLASFWRVRRLAAGLLVPYLAWVAFASALSWSIWQRNPGVL